MNEPLTKDKITGRGGQARKEVGSPEQLPAPNKDDLKKSLLLSTGMDGKIDLGEAIRLFGIYEASAVRLLRERISDKSLHNVFVGKEPPRKHLPNLVTRKWVLKQISEVLGGVEGK